MLVVECGVGRMSSGVFCFDADEVTIFCIFDVNICSEGSIDVDDGIDCEECTSDDVFTIVFIVAVDVAMLVSANFVGLICADNDVERTGAVGFFNLSFFLVNSSFDGFCGADSFVATGICSFASRFEFGGIFPSSSAVDGVDRGSMSGGRSSCTGREVYL